MTPTDAQRDQAREDLCRFVAACYYEAGPEFAEEKLFESMRAAAGRVDPGLEAIAVRLAEAFAGASPEELLVDYTRLFLGPVDALAKPYGCVWMGTEKTLMQDSTMAVQALYAEGGFDLAEDFRELPDHVAAELEFLYLLLFRENRARRDDDPALAGILALRRRFLDEHLDAWIAPFCRAIAEGTTSDFYRELASLTARFVAMEAARLPKAAASVAPVPRTRG